MASAARLRPDWMGPSNRPNAPVACRLSRAHLGRIEAQMGNSPRQRGFHTSVDGFRLEDRVVLSTTSAGVAGDVSASAAASAKPMPGMIKSSFIQATGAQLQAAYQTFGKQANKAASMAVKGVSNGLSQQTALSGLTAAISLQAGSWKRRSSRSASVCPTACRIFSLPRSQRPGPRPTISQRIND